MIKLFRNQRVLSLRPLLNLLGIIVIALTSCSKVAQMSVRVVEPAGLAFPAHIQKVALLDRSAPPRPNEKVVVGVLTGESIHKNREGAQEVLAGLNTTLSQSKRFQTSISSEIIPGSQYGGVFPQPLDTVTINSICKELGVDAVIALENYSSNQVVSATKKLVNVVESGIKNGVLGALQKGVEEAVVQNNDPTETAVVKLGFRFYDKKESRIIDEYTFSHTYNWKWETYAKNQDGVNRTGYLGGEAYGKRISPSLKWVTREYYKRSKNSMIDQATRMAIVGDWVGAVELWKKAENQLRRKKAGRAAYNLALAYEVLGNLEEAQQWCDKARKNYKNKLAKDYSYILKQRAAEMRQVQAQL